MARKKTSAGNLESETYVEIGGYVHQDEGQARTKLYVGDVDQPLKVDDAALTKRMKKVRVTMKVEEDKGVYQNQVYEKKVDMTQEIVDEPSSTAAGPKSESKFVPTGADGSEPSGLQVLKNFVDKLSDRLDHHENRDMWQWVAIALVACAVVGTIVWLKSVGG